jgi:tRNA threonylcarbamoyl adenosine modification protein (Sua5/YciO/YrdC/YwlC family)
MLAMETRVIHVKHGADVPSAAERAAKGLRAGGLVGFPTETVYGVAALATDSAALERLRELKGRPTRPFGVHMGDPADVRRYVRDVPPAAANLIAKAWPGPVTILLKVGGRLADKDLQQSGLYDVLCANDVIGLRCPDSPVTAAMLRGAGGPVVASSANRAGGRSPRSADDVLDQLGGKIDLLLDGGETRHGLDSTIVDFSGEGWKIVRKGVLDARMIRKLLTRRILMVCTGNTCRSPMAAGLARSLLAKRLGCKPGELEDHGVEVLSAGVLAGEGGRPSPDAVAAAKELGADIAKHKTRKLTDAMIQDADWVLCMTQRQVQEARLLAPTAAGKVRRLDEEADIEDPIGMGLEDYLRTARQIQRALEEALKDSPQARAPGSGRES